MILTIKNQVAGTRTYLGSLVTVLENQSTIVSRDLNVLLAGDAQFLSDLGSNGTVNIILNNGVKDLNAGEAIELCKVLATFTLEPVATMPIYYSAPVNITQTAGTAADSTVWSMRNASGSVRQVVIERIYLTLSFDAGTPIVRQTLAYDLRRFSTATPTGGTAITVILQATNGLATGVTDARFLNTGLTMTSVVFENPFAVVQLPAVSGSAKEYIREKMAFKLAPGEGLAIRLNAAALAGQSLSGEIIWSER